jgi:hypothetical protein
MEPKTGKVEIGPKSGPRRWPAYPLWWMRQKLYCMKWIAAACLWFSSFFEKALVNRVNRRSHMRTVKFWRSTWLVETNRLSGLPLMCVLRVPMQAGGE